jgi:predicted NUDIX family NTP pyrophosphohydrolase
VISGPLVPLGYIDYRKSRKRVHCFAGPAPTAPAPIPDHLEVDQAQFVPLDRARQLLHPDQREFLDMLLNHLEAAEPLAEKSPTP